MSERTSAGGIWGLSVWTALSLFLSLSLLSLTLTLPLPLLAQVSPSAEVVPRLVSYGGVLKDPGGRSVTAITGVTFLIYKDENGGAPLWLETQSVKPDATGHYTVQLGSASTHGLPAEIFMNGEGRWLGLQVGSEPEQPRVLLVAVPYAMKAADAETLGGLPLSAFVLSASAGRNAAPSANAATMVGAGTTPTTASVTTAGGTANAIPMFSTATDIENSIVTQTGSGTTAHIGINTTTPAATLDVKGSGTFRGTFGLTASGAATATAGKNSFAFLQSATAFNSGTGTSVTQNFRWQAEPVGNNTANTSGKLNLLFYSGTNTPTETGLSIAGNGQLTFAPGQTFPGGTGTITGVTAGTDLTGGGTSGGVTLNVDTTKVVTGVVAGTDLTGGGTGGVQTLNLDTTKVPQLNTGNSFVGNQSVVGNVTASGTVSGSIVNATSYALGGSSTPFASGSITGSAFLGFAGNSTGTGINNVGTGLGVLFAITTGGSNTAAGHNALLKNTTGSSNLADGAGALGNNSTGGSNTAVGSLALTSNLTGSYNTGLGYGAGPDVNSPGLTNATAVGDFATVSESNALVLGGTGANAVKVGIGTATPASTLDVRGTGNFTGLVTFAAGQTFPGAGTITGVAAGTDLTGGGTSGNVTLNLDTTKVAQLSAANTFTGNQTVNANVSATGTVSAGSFLIGNNLFGYGDTVNNVYLGFAGNKTTTGFGNTGVGGQALAVIGGGANNTAVGQAALANNGLGTDNTAIGVDALVSNTTGSYNTASGVWALRYNTGSFNTALGFFAGPDSGHPNLTNATAIGANAVVSESNAVVLGGTGANAVKVGIGTATPAYDLHVNGAVRAETGLLVGGNAPVTVDAPGIVGGRLAVLANGNVGINNANPQSTLDVAGSVRIGGDLPMSSNPRMSFSGMFPGSFCGNSFCGNTSGCTGTYCAGPGGYFVPDRNIVITRITVVVTNTVDPSCYLLPSIQVTTPGTGYALSIQGDNIVDSGPISVPISGGAPITISSTQAYYCNLGTSGGGGAFVNVEYMMQ